MHRLWRSLALAASLCLAIGSAKAADCRQAGLEQLRASSPDGYAIYRQVGDPEFFAAWMRCDDAQFDLATAVHEATHFVTSETDTFPLVGGGAIALPHEVSAFYPPSRIAGRFRPDDFTTIYLRLGKASSSTDFLFLLDELNAYSHDLNTAVDLAALVRADEAVDHRDGLAALMAFVAVYAEVAEASEPETWQGLREPRVAATVTRLWGQAERVMASSCGIPRFGTSDTYYIRHYCTAQARSALEPILGRAPICPAACLRSPAGAETQGEGSNAPAEPPHRPVAGPSWFEKIIQFKSTPVDPDPADPSIQ